MSNETKSEIIERIKKLSRMTIERGCTKEEADSALSKIRKLMLQHDLSEKDVDFNSDWEEFGGPFCDEWSVDIPPIPRGLLNHFLLMAINIGKAFNTKILYSKALKFLRKKREIVILGRSQDIELTEYFIGSVYANFTISLKSFKGELNKKEKEKFNKSKREIIISLMKDKRISELEANIVFKNKIESEVKKILKSSRDDSIFSFCVGFMHWIGKRFLDIEKTRREQATASGFMLVPVGFFDEKMNGLKSRKGSEFDKNRLNEAVFVGKEAALEMALMDGVRDSREE